MRVCEGLPLAPFDFESIKRVVFGCGIYTSQYSELFIIHSNLAINHKSPQHLSWEIERCQMFPPDITSEFSLNYSSLECAKSGRPVD